MGRATVRSWRPSVGKIVQPTNVGSKLVRTEQLSTRDIQKGASTGFADADVVIIYAKGDKIRRCRVCRAAFENKFLIPRMWWTTLAKRCNGAFGYQDVLDADGTRTGTISWVRLFVKRVSKVLDEHGVDKINYKWVKLNAFSRWYAADNRTEIILLDHPEFARVVGESLLRDINPRELGDPFWVYPSMVEEIVQIHDVSIWETRNLIRDFEKRRAFYQFNYSYLHEIPRHLTHVNETVYASESVLVSIEKHHEHFLSTDLGSGAGKSNAPNLFYRNIQSRIGSFHSILTSLRHRSEANNSRIQNEMALTYSDAARVDSSSMRTISVIGLLFLPAAFIATLFSTSFFNFDAPTGIWKLSDQFWIYWVVTIPVTALTIFLWFNGMKIMDKILPSWKRWVG
ncbi:cora-like mg2+ transporter domain-containing [Trichoderma arundinaceum]|uniref:Cora-like mg2+ transporter domain-containing n=1 Tax=Trichoderma arundinaceum TaxID=490622 RepID=A0A395NIY0_TRIAR|nr:cora-like mg2+ transporter domain-containing [Trichoderma arundinaceum]